MTWSAYDQFMIELINRARLDPLGEADRLGFSIEGEWMPASAMQVVAGNEALALAAEGHSAWMLATDTFSHTGAGGSSAGARMSGAGYDFSGASSWGENIALRSSSGTLDVEAAVVAMHRNLFISDGHRANMLNAAFTEIGTGVETGQYRGSNAVTVTENYAYSGGRSFVTGVVYDDLDGDGFYSVGEGQGGVRFTLNGRSDVSVDAGGYSVVITGGTPQVLQVAQGDDLALVAIEVGGGNVKLDLVDGHDLQSDRSLGLLTGAEDATLLGITDAVLSGNAADNVLTGNAGDNVIEGNGGSDTIAGGAGDDRLTGDAGQSEFDVYAGFVYRLYRAALDRDPDEAGLTGWVTELLNGASTASVAARFTGAAEFAQLYDGATAIGYVAQLYRNVLDREGSAEEILGWAEQIVAGKSRADVLLGFSQSPEFVRNTAEEAAQWTQAGLQENFGDDVFRLYLTTLARTPDILGIDSWTKALADGSPITQVANGFVLSTEFQATYGTLNNIGFVAQLYRNVLGREADADGMAHWNGELVSGTSRADVVVGFSQSLEFQKDTADDYAAFRATAAWAPLSDAGADTFVFGRGDGEDVITDFDLSEDRLALEADLGIGGLSGADIVARHASQSTQGVVLDFGAGDRLILDGQTTLSGLQDVFDLI